MEKIQLPINDKPTSIKGNRTLLFLKKIVVTEKLMNFYGISFLLAVCALIGLLIGMFGPIPGIAIVAPLIALPSVYAIVAYPKFGICILLTMAYFLFLFIRTGIPFPLGTLMDGFQALLLLGFFIQQKNNPNWQIFKNPVSYCILVWIGYNLLELANPVAESRMAWVYTIRTVAVVMTMYFVFMYHIRTVSFLKFLIKLWLFFSAIGALYGLKQEKIGFAAFESADFNTELMRSLLFIDGHWRIFSIFSDPVAFAYNMVASGLLCIGLLFGPISKGKKAILVGLIFIFFWSMIYSGTRGAYVLIPVGLVMLAILNFNKKVLIASIFAGAIIGVLIIIPTSNPTLYRFQSAFKPSDDASFNVRANNQHKIKPYVQSHPMGGGLGATGIWGKRFAPNSYLANFPPDSGYVRVAVELGWIGLIIFCTFMFLSIKTGIENYYKIKDPLLKSICLSMVLIAFALNIGNYPQEAFVQFPTSIYIYLVIAIINVTLKLDQEANIKKSDAEQHN